MVSYNNPPPLPYAFNRLSGRTIIVTGASSGIGEAATRLFAREGAQVVAAARRIERLRALADELAADDLVVEPVAVDVREEQSIAAMITHTLCKFGRIDGAFNNAGRGGLHARLHESSTDGFDEVLAINLRGLFIAMKHEIAAMLQSGGGSIVASSSISGLVGSPTNSVYAASKWGLAGMTKTAALEYARDNIRVNAIAPGPTLTDTLRLWMTDEAKLESMANGYPLNYVADPEDMARVALWLLSDESRWTTGVVLPCEGGRSAGIWP